jgi:hypothetical protein
MTASVQPASATGLVYFLDGGNLLASVSLTSGIASFVIDTLPAGSHNLTAAYNGSSKFTPSISPVVVEAVIPAAGAWTVSPTHISNFSTAQPLAFFTIAISSAPGSNASSGGPLVSVFSPVPSSLSGANWNCGPAFCTRSDSLPPNGTYPPITLAVNLTSYSGAQLSNQVTVSGGGFTAVTATDNATLTPAFTDVLSNDSFLPAIDLLRESTITKGCSPTTYCPSDNISQAQMAVFVVRSVIGGDNFTFTQTPYFADVPADNLYFPWIQKMQDLGIALSCGTNKFCPDTAVTRGQMAVLIIRARYGLSNPPNSPATAFFTDVLAADPFFPFIQKMKQAGITTGCSPTTYCPNDPVTRGQMAVFIMRGMFNLVPSPPSVYPLLFPSPVTLSPGLTTTVTIQGINTNFAAGTTQLSAGPGITVSNVSVVNSTTLTAQFAAAAITPTGPRSIVVTTGAEEATLPNVFRVQ